MVHRLDFDPTPDTLSLFIRFKSHAIGPNSVLSYLSAVVSQLEPYHPNIRVARQSPLVCRTLAGIQCVHSHPVCRKQPLAASDLQLVSSRLHSSPNHDDLLFVAQLFVGFDQLLRLAELCISDDPCLFDAWKPMKRFDVTIQDNSVRLILLCHKADQFFEGSTLLLCPSPSPINPISPIRRYLTSRDQLFLWHSHLWVLTDGTPPTRSWFMRRLQQFFPDSILGHSMCAGGATALAAAGLPDDRIRLRGRWTSDAYQLYLHCNPSILAAQFNLSTL